MADNVLAPLMDTPYSEIADAVIYDVVIRAQLEAYTSDFEMAMRKLRPYLEGHPSRTVREALELLRADLTNHNQAAPAATNKE